MIRRLDAFLGKRMFQPPIIWICQRAGINQYAFYRFGWMLVGLHALWLDRGHFNGWTVWLIFFALTRVLSAGIYPDRPASPSFGLRVFFLVILAVDAGGVAFGYPLDAVDLNLLMALVAEYAATITTIPPREIKEPARNLAEVRA